MVGWGAKPIQDFPEISVWRSLLEWCISLTSKKYFPLCAECAVCIYYYCNHCFQQDTNPFVCHIDTKTYDCSFTLSSEGKKKTQTNGWGIFLFLLCARVNWGLWQMWGGSLSFRNLENFGGGRRAKAPCTSRGTSQLQGVRIVAEP